MHSNHYTTEEVGTTEDGHKG